MLKDSAKGYGLVTIIFHWVCAPTVFFLFGLGVYMRSLDYYSTWYHRGPELHIAVGLLLFAIMCVRLVWRTANTNPEHLPTIPKNTYRVATAIKIFLYIFIFTICISGYLITTAEGDGASFFDLFSVPASIELSAAHVDLAGKIHKYLGWGVVIIALMHGGAALFHHFVKRDATLLRMLKPAAPKN